MPVRKKAIYAIAIGFLNFVGFMILAKNVDEAFLFAAILVAAMAGLYSLTLRCPNCGNRIYKRKVRLFGEEFTYWGGFVPKRCSHCGEEL
jgi:hypothetical protein